MSSELLVWWGDKGMGAEAAQENNRLRILLREQQGPGFVVGKSYTTESELTAVTTDKHTDETAALVEPTTPEDTTNSTSLELPLAPIARIGDELQDRTREDRQTPGLTAAVATAAVSDFRPRREGFSRWRRVAACAALFACALLGGNYTSGAESPKPSAIVTLSPEVLQPTGGDSTPVIEEIPFPAASQSAATECVSVGEFTGETSAATGLLEGTPLHALALSYLMHGVPFDARSKAFQAHAQQLVTANGYSDDTKIPTGAVLCDS